MIIAIFTSGRGILPKTVGQIIPRTDIIMKGESFFTFVAGAAIGVTLGVLFAPEKGEVTRKKIKEAAQEGYDTAKEKASYAYAEAKSKASKLHKDLDDLKEILAEEGKEIKEEARIKLLEKLNKLEKALAKEEAEDIDNQFGEA